MTLGFDKKDWGDEGQDPDDYEGTNWMARTTGVGTGVAKSLILPTLAIVLALAGWSVL